MRVNPPRTGPDAYLQRVGVFALALVTGLALVGAVVNLARLPWPDIPLADGPLAFDGRRAFSVTAEFVTTFPARSDGNPQRAAAANWLIHRFVELGYSPQLQMYDGWIAGSYHTGLGNVWAVKPGSSSDAILVLGHYDIPPFVRQGAADDGSGVGTILELARVFANEATNHTIVFLLTDTEEYGMAGARAFTTAQPYAPPIIAAVGLDYLSLGDLAGIAVECTGTQRGYTPPWLRELARQAVERHAPARTPALLEEWLERSVAVSLKDTGILLRHGIPAVNLRGLPADSLTQRQLYHTPGDTMDHLRVEAFAAWGRAAELLVRSIDARAQVPGPAGASMLYLGLDYSGYLPGWAARLTTLLLFSPLWAVVGWGWARRRRVRRAACSILRGELRRVLVAAGCSLAGLVVMKLAVGVGLLPRYELYPATAKDPFLYHPSWLPLGLALAAVVLAAWGLAGRTPWLRRPLSADWVERHHALLTLLAGLVLGAWLTGGGFAAALFLGPAACFWCLAPEPRSEDRTAVAGALAALSTAVVFAGFVILFGQMYAIGQSWWYVLLAATYGLFGLKPVVAFGLAAGWSWSALDLNLGRGLRGRLGRLPMRGRRPARGLPT